MFAKSIMVAAIAIAAFAGAGQALAQDWSSESSGYGFVAQPIRPPVDGDAQGWGQRQESGLLPPRAITGSLLRRGYRDIDIKRVRGANYVATALSPHGGRVLVVVDGQSGEITGLRPLGFDRSEPSVDWGGWVPRPWGGPRW